MIYKLALMLPTILLAMFGLSILAVFHDGRLIWGVIFLLPVLGLSLLGLILSAKLPTPIARATGRDH
jgi:hypothetical protein